MGKVVEPIVRSRIISLGVHTNDGLSSSSGAVNVVDGPLRCVALDEQRNRISLSI